MWVSMKDMEKDNQGDEVEKEQRSFFVIT